MLLIHLNIKKRNIASIIYISWWILNHGDSLIAGRCVNGRRCAAADSAALRDLRADVHAAVVGEALEDMRARRHQEAQTLRLGQAEDPWHRAG